MQIFMEIITWAKKLYGTDKYLFAIFQSRGATNTKFLQRFKNTMEVVPECGGGVGNPSGKSGRGYQGCKPGQRVRGEYTNNYDHQTGCSGGEEGQKQLHGHYDATIFQQVLLQKLVEDIKNRFSKGRENYPKTITQSYNLLTNYCQNPNKYVQVMIPHKKDST